MKFTKNTFLPVVLYVSILLSLGYESTAQHNEIAFKHLSTTDGLSNFTVLSIAEDRQGFMWFGTMDGLNRFDGKHIRTYRMDNENPYSLGNNLIYSLLCSSDSGLWVGTSQGLYHYNFYHDNFHSIPFNNEKGNEIEDLMIMSIVPDNTFLWIGTSQGLYKYDLLTQQFVDYLDKKKENDIITETVEIIHKDSDSTLWIGGKQGLFKYKNGHLSRIENDLHSKYNQSTNVISIISDDMGRVWFGTWI